MRRRLEIKKKEVHPTKVGVDTGGSIRFTECQDHSGSSVVKEDAGTAVENKVLFETGRGRIGTLKFEKFFEAGPEGIGNLSFKELTVYLKGKRPCKITSKLVNFFHVMDQSQHDKMSFHQFWEFYNILMSQNSNKVLEETGGGNIGGRDAKVQWGQFYKEVENKRLDEFVLDRSRTFANFRRYGASGELVMRGAYDLVNTVDPGEYCLLELAYFRDLPPIVPKRSIVKGVKWVSSNRTAEHGKAIFPTDFDGKIVTDIATAEHLRYYDCSFADGNTKRVSLLNGYELQDFTYESDYLEDYVKASNGGASIERHDSSHLGCPLEEDSGVFILAKLVDENELHLTGFKVPVRHTVYIPGGIIHSNDYLKGTWRTMLSKEANIDHVHLVRKSTKLFDGEYEHFHFVM